MKTIKIKTNSFKETLLLGNILGVEILKTKNLFSPLVIALYGDLGSGKTTFIQGLAKGLKIRGKIKSPTFIILRKYKINNKKFKTFYHIDAYRIKNKQDIKNSGIEEGLKNKDSILAIEWADIIKKYLPPLRVDIFLKHSSKNSREIIFRTK